MNRSTVKRITQSYQHHCQKETSVPCLRLQFIQPQIFACYSRLLPRFLKLSETGGIKTVSKQYVGPPGNGADQNF